VVYSKLNQRVIILEIQNIFDPILCGRYTDKTNVGAEAPPVKMIYINKL